MVLKSFILKIFRSQPKTKEELIKAGARIGDNFNNYGIVDMTFAHLLTVGNNVTFAGDSRIILHDASTKNVLGFSKVGCITIGDNVFIGARALILPNVKIGNNVIVGGGSIISKNIQDNCVVVGNNRIIGSYDDYMNKNKKLFKSGHVFSTPLNEKTMEQKNGEYLALKDGGFGFAL